MATTEKPATSAEDAESTVKSNEHKSDLVDQVMKRFGTPSYEAWAMTIPDLEKKLED